MSEQEVKVQLIKEQFPAMRKLGDYGDRWLVHPLPTMNAPEKAMCYLTARPESELTEDALAAMYLQGPLTGADVEKFAVSLGCLIPEVEAASENWDC